MTRRRKPTGAAERAAEEKALYLRGLAHMTGKGAPLDPAEGLELYHLAAELGSARAAWAIAVAFEKGIGVDPSRNRAFD